MSYQQLKNFILDLLFPVRCLGCQKDDVWLCGDCLQKIKRYNQIFNDWLEPNWLDEVVIVADYKDRLLSQALHSFKYQFVKDLGRDLISLVDQKTVEKFKNYILVPIPLHQKRLNLREFNQSEVLAEALADRFDLITDAEALRRVKFNVPQMTLNRQERLSNVKDIFQADADKLKNIKQVLLIDDVLTTGATLNEAAKVLKATGVKRVAALVLAHSK